MKGLIHLSGEYPDLASAELQGALRSMGSNQEPLPVSERIHLFENPFPEGLAKRMGLCHFTGSIYDVVKPDLSSIMKGVDALMEELDHDRTISVKAKVPADKKYLSASQIFERTAERLAEGGLRVRHRDPHQWIFVMVEEDAYIGTVQEWSNRKIHSSRRGSKLPFNRPIVMKPKIARAMVNISGLSVGSRILDPFLGPAGLAIEAADMGYKVVGVERDPEIYRGAMKNIHYMDLTGQLEAHNGDSRKIRGYPWGTELIDIDGIITDPPFGRSAATMGEHPDTLLKSVLSEVHSILPDGAPVVVDHPSREVTSSLKYYHQELIVPVRVHKSMTRYVALLRKE
ncbi:MAG: RsmD family RNA methyltransferase [Thermoplasmatota archaeon]